MVRRQVPVLLTQDRLGHALLGRVLFYTLGRLSTWFVAGAVSPSAVLLAALAAAVAWRHRAVAAIWRSVHPDLRRRLLPGALLVGWLLVRGAWVDALVAALVLSAVTGPPDRRAAEAALLLLAVFLGLLAVLFLATHTPATLTGLNRFAGPLRDPNELAQAALLALCPGLCDPRPAVRLGAVGLGAVAVVASQSRAGVAVLGVLLLAALIRHGRRRPRVAWALGLGGLGASLLLTDRFWHRAWDLVTLVDTGRRVHLARVAWAAFLEQPLFGVGAGGFAARSGGLAPHALPLEVLAEGGIVLLIPTLLLVGAILRAGWRARHTAPGLAGLGPLALLLSCTGPLDQRALAIAAALTLATPRGTPSQ